MADWNDRNDGTDVNENAEQKLEKQPKEKKPLTRREFYVCFVLLVVLVFWQSMSIQDRIRQAENNTSNAVHQAEDRINSRIGNISDAVAQGVEDANNPIRSGSLEIAAVDMQAKKVTLRMTATPKEYQKGMMMRFIVSCNDGAEKLTVPAMMGDDRIFTAETEVPFYDTVLATAYLQKGDTEFIREIGSTPIADAVLPTFYGSITWTSSANQLVFDGDASVDITAPEWMRYGKEKAFSLQDTKAEIYVNGKLYQTLPAECEMESTMECRYICHLTEKNKIVLKKAGNVEIFFKAKDQDGLEYSYLVEGGRWSGAQGGYDSTVFDMDDADRLTVQ